MKMIPVTDAQQIAVLAELAKGIWNEYFIQILTQAQIDYMVEKFQSVPAMTQQLADGYEYYLAEQDGNLIGYCGIHPEADGKLFLSKLYLQKAYRGKGLASTMFAFVKSRAAELQCSHIWLTVNRHNDQAIAVYNHFGMQVIREQVAEIGNGFVMDDYVYELPVS